MRAFVFAISIVAVALAAPSPRRALADRPAGDNMCTPPHDDTLKWAPATLQSLNLKLPGAYKRVSTSADVSSIYRIGNRVIGLQIGDVGISVPESFYHAAANPTAGSNVGIVTLGAAGATGTVSYDHTMESSCNLVIAGRPADITTWTWTSQAPALSNSPDIGKHYLSIIRWAALGGLPVTYVWVSSTYKSDLMSLRQIFWTAHFEGFLSGAAGMTTRLGSSAPACQDTVPAPRGAIADYLDTSLVGMLVAGLAPPLPHSSNELVVRFDSSGSAAGVFVTTSSMPDSAQQRLATIVGSNIVQQPPQSVTLVRMRVGVGDSTLSYQLVGSAKCATAP